MSFPYIIERKDVKELEVGFSAKIGENYYTVTGKRPFKVKRSFTCAAGKKLVVRFVDKDSNIGATEGVTTLKGYVGSIERKILMQLKYVGLGLVTETTLRWGKEPIPRYADVEFTSELIPKDSPFVLNRFSYQASMFLEVTIDRSGRPEASQDIWLEVIEYDFEPAVEIPERYSYINPDGFATIPQT